MGLWDKIGLQHLFQGNALFPVSRGLKADCDVLLFSCGSGPFSPSLWHLFLFGSKFFFLLIENK